MYLIILCEILSGCWIVFDVMKQPIYHVSCSSRLFPKFLNKSLFLELPSFIMTYVMLTTFITVGSQFTVLNPRSTVDGAHSMHRISSIICRMLQKVSLCLDGTMRHKDDECLKCR